MKITDSNEDTPKLVTELKNEYIENIYLIGQDGVFCIKDSARGGKKLGFNMIVLESAIATGFQKKWKQVKEKLIAEGILFQPSLS